MQRRSWTKIVCVLAVLLLVATQARADKIVLKNGRKILAYNVVEVGDKIQYETSAGTLSIPKSIVDHIEKGGLMPILESPAAAAASLNITPPEVEATAVTAEIDQAVVREGSIDRGYIAGLESEARGGGASASERAGLAHHAAAQFELAHGDLQHALSDGQTALKYQPEQATFLMSMAYVHLRRSEFKQALEYLERAKRVAPKNADVYKLAGWACSGMNRPDQAVAEWKKALELRPDADTLAALEKAKRDKQEEENYKENESAHFQ